MIKKRNFLFCVTSIFRWIQTKSLGNPERVVPHSIHSGFSSTGGTGKVFSLFLSCISSTQLSSATQKFLLRVTSIFRWITKPLGNS